MKRTTFKRISAWIGIGAAIVVPLAALVNIVWKVTPTVVRVAGVPDKLDDLSHQVAAAADNANKAAEEVAEMRGEVRTIKLLLQAKMVAVTSSNATRVLFNGD